ncbi:MAG: hypothetical protein Fues2KO_24720 [Fuerstiella sp.]
MLFWIREVGGWLLVIVAVAMIALGVRMIQNVQIVEASALMFAALGVMRMGVLLVRVSTAARICLNDQNLNTGESANSNARTATARD